MKSSVAVNLLSQMFLAQFSEEEHEALGMAIDALNTLAARPEMGEWILTPMLPDNHRYKCSICNRHHRERYDYCPSCGTKMKGEEYAGKIELSKLRRSNQRG